MASQPNWQEIARRFDAYAKHPTDENARSTIAVLPDAQVSFTGSAEESRANRIIYAEQPMTVLERQVLMRNQASVELAFRLMPIADGAFAEDLDIILGKLIRIDPVLFLTELQKAKGAESVGLVVNLGDSYVDEMKRTCTEWHLRRQSLQTVHAQGLDAVKKRAIAAIDEEAINCGTQQIAPAVPRSLRLRGTAERNVQCRLHPFWVAALRNRRTATPGRTGSSLPGLELSVGFQE